MTAIRKKRTYRIQYSPEARDHLGALTARDSRTLVDNVDRKLKHEPSVSTRNRKLLRANQIAPWELRVGDLRVYYAIEEDDPEKPVVFVKAVGIKKRDVLYIGDEEIEL